MSGRGAIEHAALGARGSIQWDDLSSSSTGQAPFSLVSSAQAPRAEAPRLERVPSAASRVSFASASSGPSTSNLGAAPFGLQMTPRSDRSTPVLSRAISQQSLGSVASSASARTEIGGPVASVSQPVTAPIRAQSGGTKFLSKVVNKIAPMRTVIMPASQAKQEKTKEAQQQIQTPISPANAKPVAQTPTPPQVAKPAAAKTTPAPAPTPTGSTKASVPAIQPAQSVTIQKPAAAPLPGTLQQKAPYRIDPAAPPLPFTLTSGAREQTQSGKATPVHPPVAHRANEDNFSITSETPIRPEESEEDIDDHINSRSMRNPSIISAESSTRVDTSVREAREKSSRSAKSGRSSRGKDKKRAVEQVRVDNELVTLIRARCEMVRPEELPRLPVGSRLYYERRGRFYMGGFLAAAFLPGHERTSLQLPGSDLQCSVRVDGEVLFWREPSALPQVERLRLDLEVKQALLERLTAYLLQRDGETFRNFMRDFEREMVAEERPAMMTGTRQGTTRSSAR